MADSKQSSGNSKASKGLEENLRKTKSNKSKKKAAQASEGGSKKGEGEVLLNLPAGLKYRMPGKRQRLVVGSIVVGLNVLLVIAVIVYFYNPSFQEFVYSVGRN